MTELQVNKVGRLVEHRDGTIDLYGWDIDGEEWNCPLERALSKYQQELIRLAKEAGTYEFGDLQVCGYAKVCCDYGSAKCKWCKHYVKPMSYFEPISNEVCYPLD